MTLVEYGFCSEKVSIGQRRLQAGR